MFLGFEYDLDPRESLEYATQLNHSNHGNLQVTSYMYFNTKLKYNIFSSLYQNIQKFQIN